MGYVRHHDVNSPLPDLARTQHNGSDVKGIRLARTCLPQDNRYDVNRINYDVNSPHVPMLACTQPKRTCVKGISHDVNGLGLPTLAHTEQKV